LGDHVRQAEIADLCCGAGGLGIEALSRGASYAYFVDILPAALKLVRENLVKCRVKPECYQLLCVDAAHWLTTYLQGPPSQPFILLADPPYQSQLAASFLDMLAALPPVIPLRAAILEYRHDAKISLPETSRFRCRKRRYGESALVILEA
jgi:16S rRNA G966 N2-methylase RsmD